MAFPLWGDFLIYSFYFPFISSFIFLFIPLLFYLPFLFPIISFHLCGGGGDGYMLILV